MSVLGTKDLIEEIVIAIGKERAKLAGLGDEKARAEAAYKRELAKYAMRLLSGETVPLDDKDVACKTQTNLKMFAEALAWEEMFDKLKAENAYKSCIVNLECLRANLNANQSIYRHLDIGGATG